MYFDLNDNSFEINEGYNSFEINEGYGQHRSSEQKFLTINKLKENYHYTMYLDLIKKKKPQRLLLH